jgi:hypothetical protein
MLGALNAIERGGGFWVKAAAGKGQGLKSPGGQVRPGVKRPGGVTALVQEHLRGKAALFAIPGAMAVHGVDIGGVAAVTNGNMFKKPAAKQGDRFSKPRFLTGVQIYQAAVKKIRGLFVFFLVVPEFGVGDTGQELFFHKKVILQKVNHG